MREGAVTDDRKTKAELEAEPGALRARTAVPASARGAEAVAAAGTLRALVDAYPESLWLIGADRTVVAVNKMAAQRLGKSVAEVVGSAVVDLFPPDIAAVRLEQGVRAFESGEVVCFEDTREGHHFATECVPVRDDRGEVTHVAIFSRDITAAQQAAAHGKASEQRYRTLFEAAADGIFTLEVTDAGPVISDCNPATERIFRCDRQALIGQPPWKISPTHQPDGRVSADVMQEIAQAVLGGAELSLEWVHQRADGTPFDAEVSVNRVPSPRPLLQAIVRDVTERKQAQRQQAKLERQLLQAQKMEAIGTLAGGVAHDINNVLAVVLGLSSALVEALPETDPLALDLNQILAAARRGRALTRNLLNFAREREYAMEPLDLNEIVDEVAALLRRTTSKMVEIAPALHAEPADVLGERGLIFQVVMNICLNAIDSIADTGTVTLATRNRSFDADQAGAVGVPAAGAYVELRVSDTGTGMAPAVVQRAFDPFFTTKDTGQGTGLGLSMAYGVISKHGGTVTIDSTPAAGSTITVLLPANAGTSAKPVAPTAVVRPRIGSGTVLVVDDEPLVRGATRRALMRLGYAVLEADSGAACLELFRDRQGEIDVVLLDLVMPRMDGEACFHALREADPKVRVIICTGFEGSAAASDLVAHGAVAVLTKPFELAALGDVVAAANA